jgi:signal transduction histidine kinase/ActR/RegA family two-component response regulator
MAASTTEPIVSITPPDFRPDAQTIDRQNEAKWGALLVAAGSLLTLLFEGVFLVLDRRFLSLAQPKILLLHSLNFALFLTAVVLALRVGPWMRRNWKFVALSFSSLLIISSADIAFQTGETEPLALALILFLAGTGPFLCWGEKLQAVLSIVAIVCFGVVSCLLPSMVDFYQWLGVLIGAAIGLSSTALERRLRRAQRQTEEALLKSRQTLIEQERTRVAGQLAAGIAHDLNNTLNVIRLRFALIAEDQQLIAKYGTRFQAINRAIDDASRTVARVRDLGAAGKSNEKESVQLSEVIPQAVELATTSIEGQTLIGGRPIRLQTDLAPHLPLTTGTPSEIRQLFLNLFLNSSDAMPEGGTITVTSEVRSESIVIRVGDEGSGIAQENLKRIFDPFFTTKGTRGTGLGLSLARKVMDEIGGEIAAANQASGGALITLSFPRAENCEPQPEPDLARNSQTPRKFLIVDDDPEVLEALRELLLNKGHAVDIAGSGAEAIGRLGLGTDYDFILCDLGMPGLSGWDVARHVAKSGIQSRMYIVTGWGADARASVPDDVVLSGIIAKPMRSTDIDSVIVSMDEEPSATSIAASA